MGKGKVKEGGRMELGREGSFQELLELYECQTGLQDVV